MLSRSMGDSAAARLPSQNQLKAAAADLPLSLLQSGEEAAFLQASRET